MEMILLEIYYIDFHFQATNSEIRSPSIKPRQKKEQSVVGYKGITHK